jgi:hypothetical protein
MERESSVSSGAASGEYYPTRRHVRTYVTAQVPLHVTQQVFIPAELLDVSATGFRVRHHSNGLGPGTVLLAWGMVSARVVWTRTTDNTRESGLELLD